MIQLAFQPALDPFHTMFRLLRLRPILRHVEKLPVDHLRILDFYVAFPHQINDLQIKKEHRRLKTALARAALPVSYGEQPDGKTVFARMEPIQHVALQTLASHALIDGEQLDRGMVEIEEAPLPSPLATRIESINAHDAALFTLLAALANNYTLTGQGGLKHRSGLLEHRYDAA